MTSKDVPGAAAQSVQLPHGEHVAGFKPLQGFGELRMFDPSVVGKVAGCAGGLECCEQIKVLLVVETLAYLMTAMAALTILLIPLNFPL